MGAPEGLPFGKAGPWLPRGKTCPARFGHELRSWTLKRDSLLLEASVLGFFAAGDVRRGGIIRVAEAVGQVTMVIRFLRQYMKTV